MKINRAWWGLFLFLVIPGIASAEERVGRIVGIRFMQLKEGERMEIVSLPGECIFLCSKKYGRFVPSMVLKEGDRFTTSDMDRFCYSYSVVQINGGDVILDVREEFSSTGVGGMDQVTERRIRVRPYVMGLKEVDSTKPRILAGSLLTPVFSHKD